MNLDDLSPNKTLAKQFLIDIYQNKDLDLIDKIISDEYLLDPYDSNIRSLEISRFFDEKFKSSLRMRVIDAHKASKNLKIKILDLIEENYTVVAVSELSGDWVGSWWGLPPSHTKFKLLCINKFDIKDNKIISNLMQIDILKMLELCGKAQLNNTEEEFSEYIESLKKMSILPEDSKFTKD